MSQIGGPDERAIATVRHFLRNGEEIRYLTAPDPASAARAALPAATAGVLIGLLCLPIVWFAAGSAWTAFSQGAPYLLSGLLTLFVLVAMVVAAFLAVEPWFAARRARNQIVLVTDQRLAVVPITGGGGLILESRDILDVVRQSVERGLGTLEVRHDEQNNSASTVLTGIRDVLRAESAIRELVTDRSITIISPAHPPRWPRQGAD